MGFSPEVVAHRQEQVEREARRSKWICEEGWHTVEVVHHCKSSAGRGGSLTFTVRDAHGRELKVPFSLSIPRLRDGELLRFVAAVLHWPAWEGNPIGVSRADDYGRTLGRHVRVLVVKTSRGLHKVIDWEPVPTAD